MISNSHTHATTLQHGNRVLRLPEVLAKTGLRKTSVYDWMAKGEFPASLPLSDKAVGWLESEIDSWLQERLDRRNAKSHRTPGASS